MQVQVGSLVSRNYSSNCSVSLLVPGKQYKRRNTAPHRIRNIPIINAFEAHHKVFKITNAQCNPLQRHGIVRSLFRLRKSSEMHTNDTCPTMRGVHDVVTPVFVQPSLDQKPCIHHRQCDKDNF